MKLKKNQIFGIAFSAVIILLSFLFREKIGVALFSFISVLALIIGVLPFIVNIVLSQNKQKQKETKFLEFLRDLVEGVKSGTPINRTILNLQKRDYGSLTQHIEKLANQLNLGLTLDIALKNLAKDTKSRNISRSVTLISEAQKAGGNIESILESVAMSVGQTEEIKKERASSVSNLVVQGYIIFIVFIVIMLVLRYAIIPIAVEFTQSNPEGFGSNQPILGGENSQPQQEVEESDISTPLVVLLLVQSFFAGLIIGKISEGNVINGIKHSFILITITLIITTGASVIIG
jgi:flagellar protein FlaJ